MAGETPEQGGGLPPRIDLRKNSGTPVPASPAASPAQEPRPTVQAIRPAPPAAMAVPVTQTDDARSQTMRITVPDAKPAGMPPPAMRPVMTPPAVLRPPLPVAVPTPVIAPAPPRPTAPAPVQIRPADSGVSSSTMRINVPDAKPAGMPPPVMRPMMVQPTAMRPPLPIAAPTPVIAAAPPRPTTPAPAQIKPEDTGVNSSTMRITVPDAKPAGTPQPVMRPQMPAAMTAQVPRPATVPASRPTVASPIPTTPKPAGPPPPVSIKPNVAAVPSGTMRITVPDANPAPAPSEAKTVLTSKKETSRIPLDMAAPTKPGVSEGRPSADGPKTIRIKPATAPAVKIGAGSIRPPAAVAESQVDEKRKTSRISLEAAFATDESSKPGEGPKTIKLKRPTEAATIKVGPRGAPVKAEDGTGDASALGKTARLDVPPSEEDEGPTPTKRKTVKIKRPGAMDESREAPQLARVGAEAPQRQPAESSEEATSWIFPVLSFVTIMVMAVLIYIIMATGLVADMGWIGKVTVSR